MSDNPAALLGTLAVARDEQERHALAWAIFFWWLLTALLIASLIWFYYAAIQQLWTDWQTATHESILVWVVGPMQLALMFLGLQPRLGEVIQNKRLRLRVRALRRAFLAGDERLAPIVETQPEPFVTDYPQSQALWIGPLRPLRNAPLSSVEIVGITSIVLGFVAGLFAAVCIIELLVQSHAANNPPLWLISLLIGVTSLFFSLSLWLIVRSVRARRPQDIEADDYELRWVRNVRMLRQGPVAWDTARAFFTVTQGSAKLASTHVYVLDTGKQVIAWEVSGISSDNERAASEALQQLIVARTKLPLRDLTASFNEAKIIETATTAKIAATADNFVGTPVRQAMAAAGLPVMARQRGSRGGCLITLALLLGFALLFVGQSGFQNFQTNYLAGLPAQIHAEQPLYQDALAAPDGDWYVGGPTAVSPCSYHYQDQSYRMTGKSGNFVQQWQQGTYSNVAVEVTVRQIGNIANDGDGVGLTLLADDNDNNFVVFEISPTSGDWYVYQYHYVASDADKNWTLLRFDTSRAIHIGVNAVNTLLAILHGNTYLFYANERFLGSFAASNFSALPVALPHSGHMGLYLNYGSTTGIFTNFSVYPVQPPSSFWYV